MHKQHTKTLNKYIL